MQGENAGPRPRPPYLRSPRSVSGHGETVDAMNPEPGGSHGRAALNTEIAFRWVQNADVMGLFV